MTTPPWPLLASSDPSCLPQAERLFSSRGRDPALCSGCLGLLDVSSPPDMPLSPRRAHSSFKSWSPWEVLLRSLLLRKPLRPAWLRVALSISASAISTLVLLPCAQRSSNVCELGSQTPGFESCLHHVPATCNPEQVILILCASVPQK